MSYRIDFNESNGVIHVVYAGKVGLAERLLAVKEVCGQFGSRRPLLILVDVSELEMVMTLEEQTLFGEYLASRPELVDARVAVLYGQGRKLPETKVRNPNVIVDLVAFNNGYRLAEFTSLQGAAEWLVN